jgi:hypothetical protein
MTFNGAITGTNILVLEAPQPITFDGAAANTLTGTVAVIEGTLVLSKSSSNATIAGSLSIIDATARWDAPNQVSDLMTSQVNVSNGGLADLAGNSETLSQLSLLGGSRLQSTSGVFTATTQIALQDSSEIDLGSGELMLQASVFRTGNSSATSRIDAALITLDQTQTIVSVADSPAAVELQIDAPIQSTVFNNSLEKQGGGALRLTGASSYLHTIVAGGTLIVDNDSGSGTGTGQVSVRTGSMLTGDGSLSGTVAMLNGATISPSASSGFPIGSLTVGILNMNAGSVFKVEFNDALPVTLQRDVLTVTGFATLGGILELENLNATNLPEPTDAYTILTTGTGDLNGSFANVANGERLGAIDGSGSFVVNYGADSPFDPNHVVLSDFLAAGDFDGDGDVDGSDFLTWQRTFGAPASPPGSGADGDGDGTVDGDDLAMWADNFGDPGPATASQSPAPEPASCVIMLAFATCLRRAPHFRRGTASAVRGRHRRPH